MSNNYANALGSVYMCVFQALRNAVSTEVPVTLTVEGTLPSWLTGFHHTLSPGIFEVKYPKMVVVNGESEQETRTFRFGHWFDK